MHGQDRALLRAPDDNQVFKVPPQTLPPDLVEFYSLTDGCIVFFEDGPGSTVDERYGFEIHPPRYLWPVYQTRVDDVGASAEPPFEWYWNERNDKWLLLAEPRTDLGMMITIDTAPERLGWVYDSFLENYYHNADRIIAKSFTEFLERLWEGHDKDEPYWLQPGFRDSGHAFA